MGYKSELPLCQITHVRQTADIQSIFSLDEKVYLLLQSWFRNSIYRLNPRFSCLFILFSSFLLLMTDADDTKKITDFRIDAHGFPAHARTLSH